MEATETRARVDLTEGERAAVTETLKERVNAYAIEDAVAGAPRSSVRFRVIYPARKIL